MKGEFRHHIIFALLFTALSSTVHAATMYWSTTDVQFYRPDFSLHNFNGSFGYDADTATVTSAYLYIDGANIGSPYTYGFDATGNGDTLYFTQTQINSIAELDNYQGLILQLEFQSPLTNAGGTVLLTDGVIPPGAGLGGPSEGSCQSGPDSSCFVIAIHNANYSSAYTGGSFSASVVPVPAAVWLFASGLGLLGWLRRKA